MGNILENAWGLLCFYAAQLLVYMYRMISSICAIQKYQVSICSARIWQPANMFLCCQTRKINPAKLTAFTVFPVHVYWHCYYAWLKIDTVKPKMEENKSLPLGWQWKRVLLSMLSWSESRCTHHPPSRPSLPSSSCTQSILWNRKEGGSSPSRAFCPHRGWRNVLAKPEPKELLASSFPCAGGLAAESSLPLLQFMNCMIKMMHSITYHWAWSLKMEKRHIQLHIEL